MKELDSPICEAVRQVAENEDAREYVETEPEYPWFNPPAHVEGDEPLVFDVSTIAETLRRSGLV
jgi:hypothetical protein